MEGKNFLNIFFKMKMEHTPYGIDFEFGVQLQIV
jgi:hypothetical protein